MNNENLLKKLQDAAIQNKNIFAELMKAVKYMSLGANYESLV